MELLKEFFAEYDMIVGFDQSNLNYREVTPDIKYKEYDNYLQQRLDFQVKWKRILRAIYLLTDDQYILLFDYFHGKYTSGINQVLDRKLVNIIYEVENGI